MRDSRSAPLSGALFASPRLLKVGFGLAADLRVVRSAHGSLRCCCAPSAVSPSVDLVNEWRKLRCAGAVSSMSPPPRASTSEGRAHGANGAAARRFVRALRDGARGAARQALLPQQLGQAAARGYHAVRGDFASPARANASPSPPPSAGAAARVRGARRAGAADGARGAREATHSRRWRAGLALDWPPLLLRLFGQAGGPGSTRRGRAGRPPSSRRGPRET